MVNFVYFWYNHQYIDIVSLYTIHLFSLLPLDVQEKILLASEFQHIKSAKGAWTVEQLAHVINALHYFDVHLNSDITKEAAFYIAAIEDSNDLLTLNKKILSACVNFKVSLEELTNIRNTYIEAEGQLVIFNLGVMFFLVGSIGITFWALVM